MSGLLPQLGLVAFLVVLNAVFAGSELALVSLREGQLRRLESESARGVALGQLARDPNRFLATIQIGITLAGFLASASAAVSLAEPLEEPLDFLGGAARPASIVVVTLILAYATLVLGELAPKRLAMQRAETWGLLVARPLSAAAVATRPIVWLLSRSTDLVVRLLGGDPNREREQVTAEEIREMVASQLTFSAQQRTIIEGAFEIADRTLREVHRPRPDVVTLAAEDRCVDVLDRLASSGHSRAPVGRGGALDDVVGIVHLRDLLTDDPTVTVEDVAAPAMILPETAGVLRAMREMQRRHAQMAVVVDEHGAAEGIVTIEDLVEEIVGEIYDETDRDVLSVRREDGGVMVVPGRYPIHDLDDIDVDVPDGPYTTVAGLVLSRLQRIPQTTGDVVEVGPWRFVVTGVGANTVTEVRIEPAPASAPEEEPG
ncbi:MAG TPA: hemolysin family protein [Acidimicrobiales bacterium]|nr:hemolysin family protein [Acidimicrobiales bacterium]